MGYKIIGGSLTDENGLYKASNGGTEQLYRYLTGNLDPKLLDEFQIICSRVDESKFHPSKKKILWLHDTWDDPESAHLKNQESRNRFDRLVFVSNYQFSTYNIGLGVPYDNSIVLRNAIVPIEDHVKPDIKDGINLIYHTTPHRGLELLVPAFIHLLQRFPKMTLDVYSSFNIYGWGHRDEQYKEVLDVCKNHPNIRYHGAVPNTEIREALKKAHVFAFPSIWPETSCLAAIEALSAGCAVVSSDLAALPETLSSYGFMYRFTERKQESLNRFAGILSAVIENLHSETVQNNVLFGKSYVNKIYNWKYRLNEWEIMLSNILKAGKETNK